MDEKMLDKTQWISSNLTGENIAEYSIDDYKVMDKYSRESFDCIALNNVLENIEYPNRTLNKVKLLLRKNGRLICTVDFGISLSKKQQNIFYLNDVFNLVNAAIPISSIYFGDSWIGIVADCCIEKTTVEFDFELFERMNIFFQIKENEIQKYYDNKLNEMKLSYEQLKYKFKKWNDILYSERLEFKKEKQSYNNRLYAANKQIQIYERLFVVKIYNYLRKIKHRFFKQNEKKDTDLQGKEAIVSKEKPVDCKEMIEISSNIKDSDGCSFYRKSAVKIAIITDEFMYNYYKNAADFLALTPENAMSVIDDGKIDCIIYVSCWRGLNNNEWRGDSKRQDISSIFKYARSKKIKTIFQSIEDPTNYHTFLPIAKESEYIFTTCKEMIESYKKDTGNKNVFLLQYGINPLFHNPIGIRSISDRYKNAVLFAGSWNKRYQNRCEDICSMFDSVIQSKTELVVVDRNSNLGLEDYKFPSKYSKYLYPAVEHSLLQKVHKLFGFNININTVQNSSTMCAMRVYELQALGCLMLSNYSLAVSETFPGLFIINNVEETKEIMQHYSENELYRMQVENIRNVMTDCTVYDRLNTIFSICNIDIRFAPKKIYVICNEKSDEIVESFERQSYANKYLITADELDKLSDADYVTYFSIQNNYCRFYLQDMVNAFKYTDCDYVTKDQEIPGDEYDFVDGKVRFDRSLIKKELFSHENLHSNTIYGKGFKLDSFEINEKRHESVGEKELAVIVPVYNNGKYLYGRCFRSLLRSSIFDYMHIYLIDDGSTDGDTISAIKMIEERYDNVTSFFFNDGGSGSASRPRNKGIEIATEPYVTFLDPDNEAINDGYAKLLNIIKSNDKIDLAFGSVIKIDDEKMNLAFRYDEALISNTKDDLIQRNFRALSIQACVIKRSLIADNKIYNPVGATGQDTLFFYELMLSARKAYNTTLPIHTYYAQRAGSVVNNIGKSFYDKFYLLEQRQVNVLKKYGVLEIYKDKKLQQFLQDWYVEKLDCVKEEDKEYCENVIRQIERLYREN